MPAPTTRQLDALAAKPAPYKVSVAPGLQLRVAPDGAKTWLVRYFVGVGGKERQYRLPQRYGSGAGLLGIKDAVAEATRIQALGRAGTDWPAEHAARVATEQADGITFAQAVRDYVEQKRRTKDGLPLAERTKSDYLKLLDRELAGLADRPINKIRAEDIKRVHKAVVGERRQDYMAQVCRAVLRWHGTVVPGDPFARSTAGRDRVVIRPPKADPSPIAPELVGAWWKAAQADDTPAGRALRFQLLTGLRPGELAGLRVRDFNPDGGRVLVRDTKNRQDHTVLLSRQAYVLALDASRMLRGLTRVELDDGRVRMECGRKPEADDPLFDVPLYTDEGLRAALARINATAGTAGTTQHKLRHTFASIADAICPAQAVRLMLNHISGGDVASRHYIGLSDGQLRGHWQRVADALDETAKGRTLGDDTFDRSQVDPLA